MLLPRRGEGGPKGRMRGRGGATRWRAKGLVPTEAAVAQPAPGPSFDVGPVAPEGAGAMGAGAGRSIP